MEAALRSGRDRLRSLIDATVVATLLLIVVGGIVRVSDSGLGCGAPGSGARGWPLCGGRLVPLVRTSMIVEYTHRFLAAIVVVATLLIAITAVRERRLIRGAAFAFALVLAQAALGALTVEHDLHTPLVAAHLATAMLLLAVLLTLAWRARAPRPPDGEQRPPPTRALRSVVTAAATVLLMTIVAGGVIAGTERAGTTEAHQVEGAHMACGAQFPTCNGALAPFSGNENVDIQLTHRTLALLSLLAIGALFIATRRRVPRRLRLALAALLLTQGLLGALNVWLGEHAALVVTHLAVGALLWATTAMVALLALDGRRADNVT